MTGAEERPIFVIGNPRSGTTLLRLMLTSHPAVIIPPEAGFAVWLYPHYQRWHPSDGLDDLLDDVLVTRKFEFWGLSRDAVATCVAAADPQNYAAVVAAIYRCYGHHHKPGAVLWGDKNNSYLHSIDVIKAMFPQARFVHIVRDGREVAVSYRELGRRTITSEYAPHLPTDARDIAVEWRDNLGAIERSFARFGHEGVFTTRLEDLTADGAGVLHEICRFLELEYDSQMLNYHQLTSERGHEPKEFLQWKEKNVLPLQSLQLRYPEALSTEEIAAFEAAAGEALARYGYPIGRTGPR